jgi:hypothetical protein
MTVELILESIYIVDYGCVFGSDNTVFKQYSRCLPVVLTQLSIKDVVFKGVIEGHPVQIGLPKALGKLLKTKRDGAESVVLSRG